MRINTDRMLIIKDYKKLNYVIVMDDPQGNKKIMSGGYTNLKSAKKDLEDRRNHYNNNLEFYKGCSNFYLVEITTNIAKVRD